MNYTKLFFTGLAMGLAGFFVRTAPGLLYSLVTLGVAAALLYWWVYTDVKPKRRRALVLWTVVVSVVIAGLLSFAWSVISGIGPLNGLISNPNTPAGLSFFLFSALVSGVVPMLLAGKVIERAGVKK